MTDRYPDCASCAFNDGSVEDLCEMCDDGDQWEDGEGYDSSPSETQVKLSEWTVREIVVAMPKRREKLKEAA